MEPSSVAGTRKGPDINYFKQTIAPRSELTAQTAAVAEQFFTFLEDHKEECKTGLLHRTIITMQNALESQLTEGLKWGLLRKFLSCLKNIFTFQGVASSPRLLFQAMPMQAKQEYLHHLNQKLNLRMGELKGNPQGRSILQTEYKALIEGLQWEIQGKESFDSPEEEKLFALFDMVSCKVEKPFSIEELGSWYANAGRSNYASEAMKKLEEKTQLKLAPRDPTEITKEHFAQLIEDMKISQNPQDLDLITEAFTMLFMTCQTMDSANTLADFRTALNEAKMRLNCAPFQDWPIAAKQEHLNKLNCDINFKIIELKGDSQEEATIRQEFNPLLEELESGIEPCYITETLEESDQKKIQPKAQLSATFDMISRKVKDPMHSSGVYDGRYWLADWYAREEENLQLQKDKFPKTVPTVWKKYPELVQNSPSSSEITQHLTNAVDSMAVCSSLEGLYKAVEIFTLLFTAYKPTGNEDAKHWVGEYLQRRSIRLKRS